MPSPFPGMDPFIEGRVWKDFHHKFIATVSEFLTARARPRYVEHRPNGLADWIEPDVSLLAPESPPSFIASPGGGATAVALEPVDLTLPMPEQVREVFLTVRKRETREVVTVVEVLSPDNKRRGSDGQHEYLEKREVVLQSKAHLVELDLLRGGARLPTIEPLPPADYYAFVSRAYRRPTAEVYAWPLAHRLPAIPVPLAGEDPDVTLDLQAIFTTVYDRAGYDYVLDYRRALEPHNEAVAAWSQRILTPSA